jgi:hypothetical protein
VRHAGIHRRAGDALGRRGFAAATRVRLPRTHGFTMVRHAPSPASVQRPYRIP